MKREHDEELCKKYPKIFKDRHASMRTTAMCWGFAVGDGWFKIIDNACWLVQQHIDHERSTRARILRKKRNKEPLFDWEVETLLKDATTQTVATQIKEKFGTLRFYYRGGDDYVDGVISMAESMSAVTCEQCGNPGKRNGGGWLTVLCAPCREESSNGFDEIEEYKPMDDSGV
jgi:hypothetical protein